MLFNSLSCCLIWLLCFFCLIWLLCFTCLFVLLYWDRRVLDHLFRWLNEGFGASAAKGALGFACCCLGGIAWIPLLAMLRWIWQRVLAFFRGEWWLNSHLKKWLCCTRGSIREHTCKHKSAATTTTAAHFHRLQREGVTLHLFTDLSKHEAQWKVLLQALKVRRN